jgi:FkbM family methyltransferase
MDAKLIYDVGMNNGDDTAYYLWRGFRVVAIEANPELVASASNRFRREIEAGYLQILNVGIAAEEGELPFWVCETDLRLSSFDRRLASLGGLSGAHEIHVPCRKFRSILDEFGMPFYLKIDIQGNDFLCIEALKPSELPKFLSVEVEFPEMRLASLVQERGFNQFKWISQTYFLPLELPPVAQAGMIQRAEWLRQSRNTLIRAFRKFGGAYWIERQFKRLRTRNGWVFPGGSSGPLSDELLGRWLSYEELCMTAREFVRLRRESPQGLLWASEGVLSNPFWADLHARSSKEPRSRSLADL